MTPPRVPELPIDPSPEVLKALGDRAVAAAGWRWTPGMLDLDSNRYQWRHASMQVGTWRSARGGRLPTASGLPAWVVPCAETRPNLADPATLGCLLHLVRVLRFDHTVGVIYDIDEQQWYVGRWETGGLAVLGGGASEAEALVNTLEAVSGR